MESNLAIAGRIGVRCVALWRIVSFTASRGVLSRPGLGIDWSGCHCTRHLLVVLHILQCPHFGDWLIVS